LKSVSAITATPEGIDLHGNILVHLPCGFCVLCCDLAVNLA
jgi:hypothetical protein